MTGAVVAARLPGRAGLTEAMLAFGGKSAAERICAALKYAGAELVYMVAGGAGGLENRPAAKADGSGKSGGLRRGPALADFRPGLEALKGRCDRLYLWPVGFPLGSDATLKVLKDNLDGYEALTPVHRGAQGYPILISGASVGRILEQPDDRELKAALKGAGLVQGFVNAPDFLCTLEAEGPEDCALLRAFAENRDLGIPAGEECRAFLRENGVLPHILRHCEKTAEIAMELARGLIASGYKLDLELVYAGALLHDILRLEENHALKGALSLARRGWFETAWVVYRHMELPEGREDEISEAAVVFMADKLAMEDRRVSLRRRHEDSCVKRDSERMHEVIWRRFAIARITEKAIAKALEMERDTL